jgi:hypothetical protein
MMQEFTEVVVLLLEIYVCFGLMWIGLGFMVLGKHGGARAARFYFGRSTQWAWMRLARLLRVVRSLLWVWFVSLLRSVASIIVRSLRKSVGR